MARLATARQRYVSAWTGGEGRSERCRLVDQHDRDVVAHRVPEATGLADQHRVGRMVVKLAIALRADEDREEFLSECHVAGPW